MFLASGAVFANDVADKAPLPGVWDWSGFYIGAGGSFNSTHFDQSLQGVSGTINVFDGTVPIAEGQEGGPFFDFNRNKLGFAPDAQLATWLRLPTTTGWLAGLKFTYKYANIDSRENVTILQTGTGTRLAGPGAPSTGPTAGFVQGSAEIKLQHQLSLIATIGHAFGDMTFYTGGSPNPVQRGDEF